MELGINFFDTVNIYSNGDSEDYLESDLNKLAIRNQIILTTKIFYTPTDEPNQHGLFRKAIIYQIDQSLKRLKLVYNLSLGLPRTN